MAEAARTVLMYLVFPLWVLAGLLDWICHRRTAIERTSGLKENLLHLLMTAEVGIGMLAVALLEIDAAVLLIVLAVFVLHELTVYWDLHYTTPLRPVRPFEQMVHSFLELLPLLSLALLATVRWDQALALAGLGPQPADFSLRLKAQPLPPAYLLGGLLAAVVLNALPLLEETWRCWNARGALPASARIRPSPGPR
ncbi:MAG: putative rane protein [Ramlibacter sp.]|nr:putative rane protein [Ramlibacter sp.]